MLILVVLRPLTISTRLLELPLEAGDIGAVHFGVCVDCLVCVCVHLQGVRSVVELLVVVDESCDILVLV